MNKTFCDICEKETNQETWIEIYSEGQAYPKAYDLCKECINKITKQINVK